MRDLTRVMSPAQKRLEFMAQPTFTVNCDSGSKGSGFLPELTSETDQFLAEGAKPLFLIPFWAWALLGAAGAAWWFWGRHHIPAPAWLGGTPKP
jgi:hypothetical protein